MDKQKQIEEMARDIGESLGITYEGEQLPFRLKTRNYLAEELVNKGYRKIPENSVAITKEELKKIIQEEYQNALKDKVVLTKEEYKQLLDNAIRVDMEYLDHELANARKETAREILKELIKNCQYTFNNVGKSIIALSGDFALNIARQYGVEIGEEV